MIKALLIILLYNTSTGEVVSVYEQNGMLPGFPSKAICEETIKQDLKLLKVPQGYALSATCVEPVTST